MTQKSPVKVQFRPAPHLEHNKSNSICHCPSSILFNPYQTPTTPNPPPSQPSQRPKLYRSFEKYKKLSFEESQAKKTDHLITNFKSTLSRVEDTKDREEPKGKLFKFKEHISHSTLNIADELKMVKPEKKVPKFLNKSQEKVQPSSELVITTTTTPQTTKRQINHQSERSLIYNKQTLTQNKRVMIRFNGRTQFFKILKFLDEGSYGKVFLVQHTKTNMIFCLKCINRKELSESDFNQLVREIKIQLFVNHPNCVNLYGFSSDKEHCYLLLEACLDGNLFSIIKKRPLDERSARKVLKEVCHAVEYLHKYDIIHRDIKPQNILIHQGSAKLCDFGWAVHSPLLRNTKCGTPIYTCPEIVKDQSYDSKIDIWCIGVLAYQLLMATIPFDIKTPSDFCKIVEDDVLFSTRVRISQNAKDFIKRCLQKQGEKRMAIRQAIEHPFLKSKEKGRPNE